MYLSRFNESSNSPCTTNLNQMVLLNISPRAANAPLGDGGVSVLGRTPARIIGELLDVPAAGLAEELRGALYWL